MSRPYDDQAVEAQVRRVLRQSSNSLVPSLVSLIMTIQDKAYQEGEIAVQCRLIDTLNLRHYFRTP